MQIKNNFKKFTKKIGSVAFALLTAVGTTLVSPISTVHAASLSDGDHSGLVSAGMQYLGKSYSTSDRLGPNSFDCSGFVDRLASDAGLDGTPLAEGWTTDSWVNYFAGAGVSYDEVSSQAEAANIAVNAGDIIIFMSGSSSVHMGVVVQQNAMMNAIYAGVRINSLSGAPAYDGAKGYSGSSLREYVAGTGKAYSSIRIYHFNTNRNLTVNIEKYSSDTSITNGNGCYSLEGAEFDVYNGSDKIGTLTTNSEGKASGTYTVSASTTTLSVKETKASKGYKVNGSTYTLNFGNDDSKTIRVPETPINDPLSIVLTKQSSDSVANPASLEGAEFEVKFYAGYYDSVNQLPAQATKTWVIKTIKDADGFYVAKLDNEHKVSGDEFYVKDGNVTIPLGTITVQEKNAPKGYLLKGATYNGTSISDLTDDGIALIKNTTTGEVSQLEVSNAYSVTDTPVRAGFEIQKHDTYTGTQPEGDATNLKTTYEVINNNDYAVEAHDANGNVIGTADGANQVVYTFTTDDSGYWKSPDKFLPYGSYTINEVEAAPGYLVEGVTIHEI